nr:hypothetical protein [Tanacetum cinerariifolium]
MQKAFPLPVMEFPLPGEVPTASEESSHWQKKRDATAEKIALLLKSSSNYYWMLRLDAEMLRLDAEMLRLDDLYND